MKTSMKYPRKRIYATVISTYLLGGISTFLTIFPKEFMKDGCFKKVMIVGGCIYLLLIVVGCILTFKRSEDGVEGIVQVHKDNDYSDITKRLNKAKHTIEIIVYHGNNLLYFTKNGIIDALKRDVDVKLLIARRDSILLKEAQCLEGSYRRKDQERAWEILEEIKREANGKTCSIRYFKYHTQARYALVIVDGDWAWWTPYHPGLNVPETSSFVLVDTGKKAIINECKKHFRTLWVKLEREDFRRCKHKKIRRGKIAKSAPITTGTASAPTASVPNVSAGTSVTPSAGAGTGNTP
jgi:hypothetical protein